MKKTFSLLSAILIGAIPMVATGKDKPANSIEMMQDGGNNEAVITQQGNGNSVVINQGGAMPSSMKNADADTLHFNPARERMREMRRRHEEGKPEAVKIYQQGGGKMEVHSVTRANGQGTTDIKSSPLPPKH